jgi:hypothetical protein
MGLDGSGWVWMGLDGSGWVWMGLDEDVMIIFISLILLLLQYSMLMILL